MANGFFNIVPIEKEKSEYPRKLIVHFAEKVDMLVLARLMHITLILKTNSIWFPGSTSSLPINNSKAKGIIDLIAEKKEDDIQIDWRGMPEFIHEDLSPLKSILIYFKDRDAIDEFEKIVKQKISDKTQSIWYPEARIDRYADKRYIVPRIKPVNPKYPVYIISKGRWESRQTSKALEAMKVPYRIVIEPQEYDQYSAVIDPAKILVLPFSNLGQGSIPARNWVWEHSIKEGHKRHWILDDNLNGFYRLNYNLKTPCQSGAIFKSIEDYCDRYKNIKMSGMNYFMFASRKSKIQQYTPNTRVYSCILLSNDIKQRWRGQYNEDTDLSIRILKNKYCTLLFNAFLAAKTQTMTMKGGNTEDLYLIEDGRLKMAQSLKDQHPDIVKITRKWGRYQHHVDYSGFKKNKLQLKKGIKIQEGVNNYGMILQQLVNGKWVEKDLNE
jgi:hypothetical protein